MRTRIRIGAVVLLCLLLAAAAGCMPHASLEYETYPVSVFFPPYRYTVKVGYDMHNFIMYDPNSTGAINNGQFSSKAALAEVIADIQKRNPDYTYTPYGTDRYCIQFDDLNAAMLILVSVTLEDGTVLFEDTLQNDYDPQTVEEYDYDIKAAKAGYRDDENFYRFYLPIWLFAENQIADNFEYKDGQPYKLLGSAEAFADCYRHPEAFDITPTEQGFIFNGYAPGSQPYAPDFPYTITFTFGKDADGADTVTLQYHKK